VHLQLGSWRNRDRLTPPPGATAVAAAACLLLASCARQENIAPHLTIGWTPLPAVGRESVAEIQLNEAMARPVTGARLRLEAFMTHPGMAPVSAAVEEQGNGHYRSRIRFTMAGDWVVRLQGTRADGRRIEVQEDVRRVRPVE
jgi:hypothetical protein